MRRLLSLLLSVVVTSAMAQQAPDQVRPDQVLAVVTADWNDDGSFDRALLVEGEEAADLLIYLSTGSDRAMELAVYLPGFAWSGAMWGTRPSLALADNGSLQVITENEAIGRDRWKQTLTVAFRDGKFVVSGYTFNARDTLEPDDATTCDVNLLNGKGIANHKAFKTATRAMTLEEWTDETKPEGCP